MATHAHDHDHGETQPVTDHIHENSWSANLEKPEHAENRALVVDQAIEAIEHTASRNHVNLVTHEAHGHPEDLRFPIAWITAGPLGESGIWLSFAISNIAGAIIAYAWYQRGTWRYITLTESRINLTRTVTEAPADGD